MGFLLFITINMAYLNRYNILILTHPPSLEATPSKPRNYCKTKVTKLYFFPRYIIFLFFKLFLNYFLYKLKIDIKHGDLEYRKYPKKIIGI